MADKGVKKRGKNLQETATSKCPEMNSAMTADDAIVKRRNQVKKLEMDFIYAHLLKRMNKCPVSVCKYKLSIRGVVDHILEAHKAVPKYVIQFEQYSEIEINLRSLNHGFSYCILVEFISINTTTERAIISDGKTMPLMVMAAKINPCGPLTFSKENEPLPTDVELMFPGELLMIWMVGHLDIITSVIRVKNNTSIANEYIGKIHCIADNNFDPKIVFARGNCLLIPANNAMQLTENGTTPLKVEIQLTVPEE